MEGDDMSPTESELRAPPCQCSYLHVGYCDETCPDDREHDPWCSQAGLPVDRSRREANDRIAVALGRKAGLGEPFITDAIVRMFAAGEWECESDCFYCGGSAVGGPSHEADCPYVLAVAYVEANPA